MQIRIAAATALASLIVLGGAATASADSHARGAAVRSPGILSGNNVQVPINIPVNVCGNTVNVLALKNPAIGNRCLNVSQHHKYLNVSRHHRYLNVSRHHR
ncbi:chaplin [Streptomyces sp. NPDC056411]|uniref:chaplin n=1 Tax=Streptomyces sp. NPDC056411 TaxID=3345813 RepID=UPI0035DDFC1C